MRVSKLRSDSEGFCSWLRTVRIRTLVLATLLCLILAPLALYWLLFNGEATRGGIDSADTARRVLGLIDFDHLSGPEIKSRIDELLRIKNSVQAELGMLEQRRSAMQAELAELGIKMEQVKMESSRESKELERLRVSIQQVKVAQQEYIQRNTPDIAPPLPLLAGPPHPMPPPPPSGSLPPPCTLSACFDFSRCSISSQLPTYVYPPADKSSRLSEALVELIGDLGREAATACLFMSVLPYAPSSLSSWSGDGRNHILLESPESSTALGHKTGDILIFVCNMNTNVSQDGQCWQHQGFHRTLGDLVSIWFSPQWQRTARDGQNIRHWFQLPDLLSSPLLVSSKERGKHRTERWWLRSRT